MKKYIIKNNTKDKVIAYRAELATGFIKRGIGLIGRKNLSEGNGMVIIPCSAVHTFFMRFAIDLIYLSRTSIEKGKIIDVKKDLKPWRLGPIRKKAEIVIELPVGVIEKTASDIGDEVQIWLS